MHIDNYFCSIYEASKKFYGSEWIQNSGLPNCLDAKDYIDYLSALESMESDINKVKSCNRVVLPQSAFWINESGISLNRNKDIVNKMIKEQLMNNGAPIIYIFAHIFDKKIQQIWHKNIL